MVGEFAIFHFIVANIENLLERNGLKKIILMPNCCGNNGH